MDIRRFAVTSVSTAFDNICSSNCDDGISSVFVVVLVVVRGAVATDADAIGLGKGACASGRSEVEKNVRDASGRDLLLAKEDEYIDTPPGQDRTNREALASNDDDAMVTNKYSSLSIFGFYTSSNFPPTRCRL
jgi:hypothetical protein